MKYVYTFFYKFKNILDVKDEESKKVEKSNKCMWRKQNLRKNDKSNLGKGNIIKKKKH